MSDYPAEWVEKAAAALSGDGPEFIGSANRPYVIRAVLDAVAPTIRAEAWERGNLSVCDEPGCECDVYGTPHTVNPYREVAQ